MRHIIASGEWLFSNVPPLAGYGFKEPIWALRDPAPQSLDGGPLRRMFVPLLRVEGVSVDASVGILAIDPMGTDFGSRCLFFSAEKAVQWQQRRPRMQLYDGIIYPPFLPPHEFRIEERGETLVALPDEKKEDLLCLLLFGEDYRFRLHEETTTASVLRTAYTRESFLGIALLKPDEVVTMFRGGWTHSIEGYLWNGQELQMLSSGSIDDYRSKLEDTLAGVR